MFDNNIGPCESCAKLRNKILAWIGIIVIGAASATGLFLYLSK